MITPANRAARVFAAGQVILGISLLACVTLIPHYFFSLDQGGISNFGTEKRTIYLFIIGFSAATIGTLTAATTLPNCMHKYRALQNSLYGLSLLYLLVALSTFSYKTNVTFKLVHEWAAVTLFLGMLIIALWLRFAAIKDIQTRQVFAVFVAGFAVAILTFLGILHILFTVQVICGLAFGYLLSHAIRKLTMPIT